MKKLVYALIILTGTLVLNFSCKNGKAKENTNVKENSKEVIVSPDSGSGLIVIARDIITEVIVKPDSLGDPWEVEKVRNYSGKQMFTTLFENIHDRKVTVYDNLTGNPLGPEEVSKMEKEIGSDLSRIAKIQFLEDWFFNPSTNKIIKKLKSASFGYILPAGKLEPVRYKALFKLKIEE